MNSKGVTCSVLENSTAVILPPFRMTCLGERNGMNSHISSRASSICQHNIEIYSGILRYTEVCRDILTSSGTALMLVKPFLKTTNTFFAPHRRADVAQSKAVSPAPSTIAVPRSLGRGVCLHEHIPAGTVKLYCEVVTLSSLSSLPPLPGLLVAATTGKKSLEV